MKKLLAVAVVMLMVVAVVGCKETGEKDGGKKGPAAKEPGLPVLFSFETDASVAAWLVEKEDDIDKATKVSASTKNATDGKRSLKMVLSEHDWPGAYTETLATKDWSGYKELKMDVTVEADVSLAIRIDDTESDGYDSRFQETVELVKGKNEVAVLIEDVDDAVSSLKKIKRLTLFSSDVTDDIVFYIDNIRLVKEEKKAD